MCGIISGYKLKKNMSRRCREKKCGSCGRAERTQLGIWGRVPALRCTILNRVVCHDQTCLVEAEQKTADTVKARR